MKKLWGRSMVVQTLVGEETEVRGDLQFAGGLHLDGVVKGRVMSTDKEATLSIGASGRVEGDVWAARVVLHGQVNGHVYAEQHVSLGPKARVNGNLYYRSLEMAAGAKVMGQLVLQEEPAAGAPVKS